jgi:23S rRNA (cytosine1962-C5)-methyltransferase
MTYPTVTLAAGRDTPVRAGHPWIFSKAIAKEPKPSPENGALVEVLSAKGDSLGLGTWGAGASIRVRMLTTSTAAGIDKNWFVEKLREIDTWKRAHLSPDTDGYRVVYAESDGIPGLIVDRYADVIVFQIHTAGMDRLREEIIEALKEVFEARAIAERSDIEARLRDGLQMVEPVVRHGAIDKPVEFHEHGLTFFADVMHGQKTGFFLDQRDARHLVGTLSKEKRVLNLFGYSGGFSVHAAKGGAAFVATVDMSEPALELAQQNLKANGFDPEDESKFLLLDADVMDLLRAREIEGMPYDMIVCDPPAFAKTGTQSENALEAYTKLNMECLTRLGVGGILVTSSCSGRVTSDEFRSMLRIAAGRAGRDVRVIAELGHAADHAERIAFPEGRYLKTMALEVTNIIK